MRSARLRRTFGLAGALLVAACAAAPPRDEAPAPAAPTPEPAAVVVAAPATTESATDAGANAPTPDASVAAPLDGGAASVPEEEEEPPPPPKGKRYRPLGACVDPLQHAKRLMGGPSGHAKAVDFVPEPYLGVEGDLDGDGEPDQLLVGDVANVTTTYYVYVMRGKCGHFAGRIDAVGRMSPVGGYTQGLRALGGLAPCQPACCKTLEYSEYRYDGARFKLAKKEPRKVSDCAFGAEL